ncbi:hypothetical protein [Nocardia spumae]|nr:hypothetical protein [Nocardia spumae]
MSSEIGMRGSAGSDHLDAHEPAPVALERIRRIIAEDRDRR